MLGIFSENTERLTEHIDMFVKYIEETTDHIFEEVKKPLLK